MSEPISTQKALQEMTRMRDIFQICQNAVEALSASLVADEHLDQLATRTRELESRAEAAEKRFAEANASFGKIADELATARAKADAEKAAREAELILLREKVDARRAELAEVENDFARLRRKVG